MGKFITMMIFLFLLTIVGYTLVSDEDRLEDVYIYNHETKKFVKF